MGGTRAPALLAVVACLGLSLTACSPSGTTTSSQSGRAAATSTASAPAAPTPTHVGDWRIVALGDSVPYGTACGCTPYPTLTGVELKDVSGQPTVTTNDAS